MNYIKEINSFYDWLETNSVSDSAINLWHGLLHVNNKASSNVEWKSEFTVAISTLQVKTGLSKSSIIRARNQLKQLGRIDFRERKGNQSAVYKITAFHTDTQSDTQSGTQSDTQSGTQSGTQTDTINKLNKTKQNSILLKKESKGKILKNENLEEVFQEEISGSLNTDSEEKEKSSAKKEKEKFFTQENFKQKLLDLGVLEQHANDWIEARKKKRASFTESVIDAVIRECEKYNYPFPEAIRNCAEHSWQGFKYQWLENEENGKSNNQNANNGSSNNRNGTGKVNGRSDPFTVEDFIQSPADSEA